MSAKGELLMTMIMRHVAEDTARELIDAALNEHAHELAERIRNSEGWRPSGEWMDSRDRDHAARLVDPKGF